MASTSKSKSAAVRARLSHPVIDSDGHQIEYGPRIRDYIKDVAGASVVDRFGSAFDGTIASSRWYRQSPEQRRDFRTKRSPFWGFPTRNTRDLALAEHPYVLRGKEQEYRVSYSPAESDTGMFGGNSNWRGPIWMPVNALIIRAVLQYYSYYGNDLPSSTPPVLVGG